MGDVGVPPADAVVAAQRDIANELANLLPSDAVVIDAHAHLGADEDGQSLDLSTLIGFLDDVRSDARACAFAFHDPEREPAYRKPNDRVLAWAAESGGRVIPYCRLDPADDALVEAERCLGLGARGIKLHPRAQGFGFDTAVMGSIFEVAADASVPILIHAGRGMPPMDALADIALRYPQVPLVLAHAAIADQGMFASRLRGHPAVLYDTSCFSPMDVIELFARVPAERIVFASDVPYGRPASGLFQALRIAAVAGLDDEDRRALVGGTMQRVLEREPLAPTTGPRVPERRSVHGRLLRVSTYLSLSFGAFFGGLEAGQPPDPKRVLSGIALARSVCRDPDPSSSRRPLLRIDAILAAAEQVALLERPRSLAAIGLLQAASVIAATEP
jgi:predicted TIM-barrel fold metal-dependent hydrolase